MKWDVKVKLSDVQIVWNTCTPNFLSCFTYSVNWKSVFVSVLIKEQWSTAVCKIYDFEYVKYARTRFVKAWYWIRLQPKNYVYIYVHLVKILHIFLNFPQFSFIYLTSKRNESQSITDIVQKLKLQDYI